MTRLPRQCLNRLDSLLLHWGQCLVPAEERSEWLRSWQAELWYVHASKACRGRKRSLTIGLLRDALWLRSNSWRMALSGTALLCLALLGTMAGLATIPAFLFAGGWRAFANLLETEFPRFAVASSLLLVVSYAKASGTRHHRTRSSVLRWLRVRAFFTVKVTLLLVLTFLASTDLCMPLESRKLFIAIPVQLLLFVILTLLSLRWSFYDDERRCKHCLRSLKSPARVGRPSWNFLEYNGIELVCRNGHGLLTVPEIETSWCSSSTWIPQRLP